MIRYLDKSGTCSLNMSDGWIQTQSRFFETAKKNWKSQLGFLRSTARVQAFMALMTAGWNIVLIKIVIYEIWGSLAGPNIRFKMGHSVSLI